MSSPEPVNLDATIAAWLQAARVTSAEIARLTEMRDRAIDHIKQAMGDATEARIDGQPVATWRPSKPATFIDAKALAADMPEVAEKYTRTKQTARPFKILDVS